MMQRVRFPPRLFERSRLDQVVDRLLGMFGRFLQRGGDDLFRRRRDDEVRDPRRLGEDLVRQVEMMYCCFGDGGAGSGRRR